MSIRAFFAPDTPALRWGGCRAGVFCASGNRNHPRHHRRITRRIGSASPPQHSQTRRVIRRLPPSPSKLLLPPDTLAGRRAGVFCASGNRIHPRHHRRITRRIGNAAPPQHSQTRRVIRRPPPSPFKSFFAPDTPALRLVGCRAGVFCASETEFTPDTTAELPAGLGTPRPPTLPNQAGNPAFTFITIQTFLRRTHPPYG
jgi:hypothetical protein